MKNSRRLIPALVLAGFMAGFGVVWAAVPDLVLDIKIPYQKFVLSNGLTLLMHEDHKAPIVVVNLWYHVGSKNEKPGRTGFAHLFEHLMFNGSENFNQDYFQVMERIGATDLNGTTSEDRTNYFQNVPVSALDTVLWLESDRMGHLLGAIDQAKLDEQRGVVQNEKREYENEPYGKVDELISRSTFPAAHPYSWTVIGSMEDLNAASLADVKEWFQTYYGPSNTVLVIAGDIDPKTAKEKVEKYFGAIPPGPPVARQAAWTAKRTGIQRQVIEDRVPQARIYQVWNVPHNHSADFDYLNLVSDVLGSGKNSRLYERLVYRDQIASDVTAYLDGRESASQFVIRATARPGQDLKTVEKALDEEVAKLLADGPREHEVDRVKVQHLAGFIRGLERIGGFGGKSDILAQNQVFSGNPEYYQESLKRVQNATPRELSEAARVWLSDGVYALEVHPFGEFKAAGTDADRKRMPQPGGAPEVRFPALEKATLSNGVKVVLARNTAVPVVSLSLLIDAGYAADQAMSPGATKLAMNLLDEGTKTRTSLQISEQLAQLGATLNTGSNLDGSSVNLSVLERNLDPALEVFSEVVLNPSFPEAEFQRLQKQQMDAIQQEKVQPIAMALRVLPRLLYGDKHIYGTPLTGSGTDASVKGLTNAEMRRFHETWFKADSATVIAVGDIAMVELQPKLEKALAAMPRGKVPAKNIPEVPSPARSLLYLIDRPDSLQSMIFSGQVAPPTNNPDEVALQVFNDILGGVFTSRLNMNIREDKHWSYGAGTGLMNSRGPRPFFAYTSVQTDKTKEAVAEIRKEFQEIGSTRPVTEAEAIKARDNQLLQLPGTWETNAAVGGTLSDLFRLGLPEDYYQKLSSRLRELTPASIAAMAGKILKPDQLVWVVVGDRAKIETGLKELGLGEIQLLDADGNPLAK